jgi:hypothetical protein
MAETEPTSNGVTIATERGSFNARMLLGADVWKPDSDDYLWPREAEHRARADGGVPVAADRAPEFVSQIYRFDFNCVAAGVNGYS